MNTKLNLLTQLVEESATLLLNYDKTLAVAESCTGGLLSHLFTNIPGSSNYFKAGIVVYSNDAKIRYAKVPSGLINAHGAVSSQVADALATGIRRELDSDFGIGITGIAGPSGATSTKPVGLVFIACVSRSESIVKRYVFNGTRIINKEKFAEAALKQFIQLITSTFTKSAD